MFKNVLKRSSFAALSFRLQIFIVVVVSLGMLVFFGLLNFFSILIVANSFELSKFLFALLFIFIISIICCLVLTNKFLAYEKSIRESDSKNIENSKYLAIAKTTQMLAHDVRKPFSLLKMALEPLQTFTTVAEMKEFIKTIIPEVNQAMLSVNGLLEDTMEICQTREPLFEPTIPESIIEATLWEVFQINPEVKVNFKYNFSHTRLINVDNLKVMRVFANITNNAAQAIKQFGGSVIWFNTKEIIVDNKQFVEFTIGNNGPAIPQENMHNLFDTFFTKDKKNGTGLGLAIAKKIVSAHGGKIWCESNGQESKVEFKFTLPACENELLNSSEKVLPALSQEIYARIATIQENNKDKKSQSESNTDEAIYEDKVVELSNVLNRKISLGILDDESLYRNALKVIIEKTDKIANILDIKLFKNSEEILNYYETGALDILISDLDLGANSLNGYEVVTKIRENKIGSSVCIHSNRGLPEDYKKSIEVGADAFFPKPMSRTHLLKFITFSLEQKIKESTLFGNEQEIKANFDSKIVPKVALLDDGRVFLTIWKNQLADIELETYLDPEPFLEKILANPEELKTYSLIITDNRFAYNSKYTGIDFAKKLKELGCSCPIFLCSNSDFELTDNDGVLDYILPKEAFTWTELKKIINNLTPKI